MNLTKGGPAGFTNPIWFNGAYLTTLPRGKGGKFLLNRAGKSALANQAANWPLTHTTQSAFDTWLITEITFLTSLVHLNSPMTFWSDGRSQKFINVLLKYACTAYHCGLPAFAAFVAANPSIHALTNLLHAPIDRTTVVHAIGLPSASPTWGTKYRPISWWQSMTLHDYRAIQAVIRTSAMAHSLSPIHYEMAFIW